MKNLERTKYKQQKSHKASKILSAFWTYGHVLPSNLYLFILLLVKLYSFVCLFIFSLFFLFFFLKDSFTINQSINFTKVSRFTNYEYSLIPSLTRQTQTPNMDLMIPTAQNPRDGIPSRSAPLFFETYFRQLLVQRRRLFSWFSMYFVYTLFR